MESERIWDETRYVTGSHVRIWLQKVKPTLAVMETGSRLWWIRFRPRKVWPDLKFEQFPEDFDVIVMWVMELFPKFTVAWESGLKYFFYGIIILVFRHRKNVVGR